MRLRLLALVLACASFRSINAHRYLLQPVEPAVGSAGAQQLQQLQQPATAAALAGPSSAVGTAGEQQPQLQPLLQQAAPLGGVTTAATTGEPQPTAPLTGPSTVAAAAGEPQPQLQQSTVPPVGLNTMAAAGELQPQPAPLAAGLGAVGPAAEQQPATATPLGAISPLTAKGGLPPAGCDKTDDDVNPHITGATCKITASPPPDYDYCMPDLKLHCKAPINAACRHCMLLWEAVDKDGVCQDTAHTPNNYCFVQATSKHINSPHTTIQIAQQDANGGVKHWKIVPNVPNRGVEDTESPPGGLALLDALWQDGWDSAVARQLPFNGKSVPSMATHLGDFGLVINSPNTRRDHQMHIHIAKLDAKLDTKVPGFKDPGPPYTNKWIPSTSWHGKTVAMMCPQSGKAKLTPYTHMRTAITNKDWTITNKWYETTIAVIKASFCKGGNGCDWCMLLLQNVGDKDILDY